MKSAFPLAFIFSCSIFCDRGACAEEIEIALGPGHRLAPFQVKDCTGPAAGKSLCYYCRYGQRPVVGVIVREWTNEAAVLIAQIDREVDLRRNRRLAAFVVSLADDTRIGEEKLRIIAQQHHLERVPLTICRESLEKLELLFGFSSEASLAVYTWRGGEVQTARAFDDPRLSPEEIRVALRDVRTLAP